MLYSVFYLLCKSNSMLVILAHPHSFSLFGEGSQALVRHWLGDSRLSCLLYMGRARHLNDEKELSCGSSPLQTDFHTNPVAWPPVLIPSSWLWAYLLGRLVIFSQSSCSLGCHFLTLLNLLTGFHLFNCLTEICQKSLICWWSLLCVFIITDLFFTN